MIPATLTFGSPLWLWGLVAIPVLIALYLRAERQAARALATLLPAPRLRAQLTGAASVARRRWRYALLLLGLAGLVVATAQPRLGYEMRETHRRGLDVVVVVDVSKSMLATDLAPSRLARAKLTLQDLLPQLDGDRVGLVAFAGTAFLQAPLTIDYDDVLRAADELDTDLIPVGGTNLGGGIDLAMEAFGKAEAGNRAILLLSDGEPTADGEQADGVKAAGRAADAGVRVFTMGFGTAEGSLIPLGEPNNGEFVRDADGQIVRTRLNEGGLTEIAKAGGGFYVHFENGGSALRTVVQDGLAKLKTAEIDARSARRPLERYQWPLGLGLVALSLGVLLGERRPARAPAARPARPAPVRRAVAAALFCLAALRPAPASNMPDAPPASANPLDLYRAGHYDEAYRAFESLARGNPKSGNLQFDAGASAYMGKQYDQALDAFGQALTSDDPALQANSHYNFGNALFRRGEQQKDQKQKISDWRDAIQHYETTLNALKSRPPHTDDALASNTAFNRDVVQRRLDEELKQPPQQQKQDKQDKQDQQKQDQKNGSGQDKPQPTPSDGKQDQSQGQGQQQQSSGQSGQSAQQDQSKQSGQSGQDQQNQPPQDGQAGQKDSAGQPDPDSVPNQDKPRERGDFNAQKSPAQPSPAEDSSDEKDGGGETGKMTAAQASALLQSLRDEDTRVNLNDDARKRRDDAVLKDW